MLAKDDEEQKRLPSFKLPQSLWLRGANKIFQQGPVKYYKFIQINMFGCISMILLPLYKGENFIKTVFISLLIKALLKFLLKELPLSESKFFP